MSYLKKQKIEIQQNQNNEIQFIPKNYENINLPNFQIQEFYVSFFKYWQPKYTSWWKNHSLNNNTINNNFLINSKLIDEKINEIFTNNMIKDYSSEIRYQEKLINIKNELKNLNELKTPFIHLIKRKRVINVYIIKVNYFYILI
jgi:hypothetical protein